MPRPRTAPQRRPDSDPVDATIVEVAKDNPTDGYRMVTAWARRRLGAAVNRKRVLRVMREQRLIQRRRSVPRRRRPGFFQVERPAQLWHMDMTLAMRSEAPLRQAQPAATYTAGHLQVMGIGDWAPSSTNPGWRRPARDPQPRIGRAARGPRCATAPKSCYAEFKLCQ